MEISTKMHSVTFIITKFAFLFIIQLSLAEKYQSNFT
jgi:hypothetical protein